MSICSGPEFAGLKAGATAAAAPAEAAGCEAVAVPALVGCGATGVCGSGSRMSAPSPRPKAFLGIGNYLLCKLRVSFGTLTMYIIENNRFTKTRSLGKTNIPRNQALEDLRSKEAAQIRRYLARKTGPLVVHRQENAFNLQAGIQGAPDPHQGVQKFRDALQSQ